MGVEGLGAGTAIVGVGVGVGRDTGFGTGCCGAGADTQADISNGSMIDAVSRAIGDTIFSKKFTSFA